MKENKDINLYRLVGREENEILLMIESDSDLRKTFKGKENTWSRIKCSEYSALIRNKKTPIGFIMIVYNGHTNKYEIDMGILKQYRNNGYGTKALDLLKDVILFNELKVEVQTKKTNKAAIQSIVKNGFVLCREDKFCNYYTLKEDSKQRR